MKAMASQLEIELDDGECRVMKLIQQAHQEKVTCVRIDYWGEVGGIRISKEQFDTIFTGVGSLPNLKDAILRFTPQTPPLPVRALQQLIDCHHDHCEREQEDNDYELEMVTASTTKLEYLSLHHVKLEGSSTDFEALSDSLRNNQSLKNIHLIGCSSVSVVDAADQETSRPTDGNSISQQGSINEGMNVMLEALAHLKPLETLHIDNVCNLSQRAFQELCQSTNLQLLEFWNIPDDLNLHGYAIANALCQSRSLKELEISSTIHTDAGNAIIHMLQTNRTLETLGLDLDYVEYGQALARVFQPGCNTTLKTLRLRLVGTEEAAVAEEPDQAGGNDDHDDAEDEDEQLADVNPNQDSSNSKLETGTLTNAQTLITALESNTSLEHMHLNFYNIDPEHVQSTLIPFAERLLTVNFVLKDLTLRGKHNFTRLSEDAQFCLRLNRAGRYALLLGGSQSDDMAPRCLWVETIAAHQQDVSIVYYLLSTSPSLCCAAD
jgi:hypothetical protein